MKKEEIEALKEKLIKSEKLRLFYESIAAAQKEKIENMDYKWNKLKVMLEMSVFCKVDLSCYQIINHMGEIEEDAKKEGK